MFDNFITAVVQGIGFFGVFGFFVYQLLSESKQPIQTKSKLSRKKVNDLTDINYKVKKKGLFGRKEEPIQVIAKPKKKGLFGRKEESTKEEAKPKKGLFARKP